MGFGGTTRSAWALVTGKIRAGVDLSKRSLFRRVGALIAGSILLDAAAATDASACGAVARRRGPAVDPYASLPYLAIEQTLIAWDRATRVEDFVREARFARTTEPFGFVVPVPGKPEVAKIDSPFPALRKEYPYHVSTPRSRSGGSKAGGAGGGGKAAEPPPLEVLSVQRVGSFDVTTLRATAVTALDEWLATNGFELTEGAKPWLAYYVTLHFYFVAFKYAGAAEGAADGMTSETVRIRFETGAPFYPYLEPETPRGTPLPNERMLAVWLVTQDPMLPIVTHTRGGEWTWQTPWESTPATSALTANFLSRIPAVESTFPIRAKNVWVQPYLDLRTSRVNLGDAVFGYRGSHDLNADDVAALRPLLPALDARIAPAPLDAEGTSAKRRGCSAGADAEGAQTSLVLFLVGIGLTMIVLRRRRTGGAIAIAALGLAGASTVGCQKRATVADEKERAVVELLSGRPPYTLQVAPAARLVTKLRVDAPTSDVAEARPTSAIVDRAKSVAECLTTSMPDAMDLEISSNKVGSFESLKVVSPVDAAVAARVSECWYQSLGFDQLVEPRIAVKLRFHATVSQELVD